MEVPAHIAQLNRTFANFQMLVEFESIMLIAHVFLVHTTVLYGKSE